MGHTEQRGATTTRAEQPVSTGGVFFSFAPWIVFGVVAAPSTWEYAALAALIAAVVLFGRDMLRGRCFLRDTAGIVFFAELSCSPSPSPCTAMN
ncbi:hypothetical protein ACFV2H_24220 [Streptomyces sp. NPDC059629]|uniref:hypothetical protein n=1 Tax=Streptomyces sp. NPDC059629 TaxID=3346889 RepID=UPI0036839204